MGHAVEPTTGVRDRPVALHGSAGVASGQRATKKVGLQ